MPGTTNFLVWNPNETNQETDAQYLADSQRTGGAVDNTPLPAPLGNKGFHQWSTFCSAFGKMMANKPGEYSTSDADVDVLAAVLSNLLTESDLGTQIISVAYSPTPAFNAASSNGFQMTLAGNITSSTIAGITPGQLLAFYFVQDSVGGRTVSWPSSFVGTIQPDPSPNSVSVMLFRADISGVPRAVSPMISNNGVFFGTITASTYIGLPRISSVRTSKTGIYLSGVLYTNSSASAVYEEITMAGPGTGSTGSDYLLSTTIGGVAGPSATITNDSYGYQSVGFWVPAGNTFSATVAKVSGGAGAPTINKWTEVSF